MIVRRAFGILRWRAKLAPHVTWGGLLLIAYTVNGYEATLRSPLASMAVEWFALAAGPWGNGIG